MIKRNNPGNITKSKNKWIGEITGDSSRFVTFDSLPYGYRAMIKLLQVYIKRGTNSIRKIINVYAPPSENPTENYIQFVSKKLNIDPDTIILHNDLNTLANLVLAMSIFEHGLKAPEIEQMKNHVTDSIQLILTGSNVQGNTSGTTKPESSQGGRKLIWIEFFAVALILALLNHKN